MTEQEKHTPGPWSAAPVLSFGEFEIAGANKEEVALIYGYSGGDEPGANPSEANARLIAAAPELLEALKAVLDDKTRTYAVRCMKARAVIAKAEGRADPQSTKEASHG